MKTRRKTQPVTKADKLKGQKLISAFHTINKKMQVDVEEGCSSNGCSELNELGGLRVYQRASIAGSKVFNSSKWLIRSLGKIRSERDGKLRLLDVGALCKSYESTKWIDATYIDLLPVLPSIQKANILNYQSNVPFDVICLSLVLNFEGCPMKRFKIIQNCKLLLNNYGYCYIVLPKPAIIESRYINEQEFLDCLRSLKFKCVDKHYSPKLAFFLLQLDDNMDGFVFEGFSKHKGKNNFRIKPC